MPEDPEVIDGEVVKEPESTVIYLLVGQYSKGGEWFSSCPSGKSLEEVMTAGKNYSYVNRRYVRVRLPR